MLLKEKIFTNTDGLSGIYACGVLHQMQVVVAIPQKQTR